ncbi:5-dehydro-2-deoxygluconokinase [Serratia liquefaciens]|jgi:2-dehydro-3-deoxygluconokinase|uniref:sugar kinase n=1 Tax=Serratia liquefaciens TaxID=614 RepID=UPI000D51620D|nr:sugar kinase [Serratia liquefaciens]MDU5488541.1 sugar kinase [Serratia liquefaciens]PVD40172.1 ketodeoxygluconokinase [Serratia liquefaciens]QHT53255.1 sugar kinase [Serratia liquefaciens]CAI2528969.1 5-dehydro-2-deoxygluconokinase [Serratia liquefaciens]HCT9096602.1 sugar kinase [Serratia liquefaciens]
MTTQNLAVIGECMIELSQKGADLSRGFGGDTLNTAVYVARQVAESTLQVHYVTALGTDSFSDEMLHAWQQEKVNTRLVQRLENKLPGLYVIETDEAGERTFYYWRNDAAARYWLASPQAETLCEQLAHFDYLYLSGISVAILDAASRTKLLALLRQCRANGGKVIFDNNYRPRLWQNREETQQAYREVLACTDIAFLTLDDEDLLWGKQPVEQVVQRTQQLGVMEIVIKRGAEACLVFSAEGTEFEIPAVRLPKEKVVDTTAAGDSFSAGYLAVRLTGGDAVQAAQRGHLTASTVIQHRGAIIPLAAMPQ